MSGFRYANNKWYGTRAGCGCIDYSSEIHLPEDSKPILLQLAGTQVGPVTGQVYNIWPAEVSIDIRTADADAWIAQPGKTRTIMQGHRGRLTRVSS